MIDHDVLADFGSLSDDHTHAVVNEETPADGGAWVDFDAGQEAAKLGDEPRRRRCRPGCHP
jgi:hypothetical protein